MPPPKVVPQFESYTGKLNRFNYRIQITVNKGDILIYFHSAGELKISLFQKLGRNLHHSWCSP